jgi:endonuclease/exonuclease/phosphatase family metal-dependent hydrolase
MSMQQYGLVCMYGDPRHRSTSIIWENVLNFVVFNSNLPMFCMGDFNELMHANEKLGPNYADVNRIHEFCMYVKQCRFIDLDYSGPTYTWTNKRFSSVPTYERLDRCLGNAEWSLTYPAIIIYHLPMMYSDHAPMLVVLNMQRPRTNKPFRFKNWWLMEQEYHDIAKQS